MYLNADGETLTHKVINMVTGEVMATATSFASAERRREMIKRQWPSRFFTVVPIE